MDKQNKHSNNSLEKYLKYFKNLLSGRERHALEKDMMRDPFEEEAYEGLSQLSAEEFSEDIAELQNKIEKRTRSRKLISLPIVRYAAAAILVLSLGTLVILVRQSPKEASKMIGQEIEKDTFSNQKPARSTRNDSLGLNIAYQPVTEEESVEERTVELKVEEKETVQPSVINPSTVSQPVLSEADYDIKSEAEEMADDEQQDQYVADEIYPDEVSQPAAAEKGRLDRRNKFSSKRSSAYSTAIITPEKNTITGRVLSASDEAPLPGVNILVKGTTTGTVSDIEGNFRIEVPVGDSSILQFDYIGYASEEMEVYNLQDVTITLTEDMLALDEVVVVGYGTSRSTESTGAISSIEIDNNYPQTPTVIPPKPAEGFSSYKKYIRENTRYKNLPQFDNSVTVKLRFRVSESGAISRIVIEKSDDHAFDQEAIRLVREGPLWLPGTEDGRAISQEVTLKVKFQPEKNND